MLIAFVLFTACPGEDKIHKMEPGIAYNICSSKSELLMMVGSVIICMIVYKMLAAKIKRNNSKQKLKQK